MEGSAPTALIAAYEPGLAPGGLRALLPIAGMSMAEHQARRAVAAGAGKVLFLIDETPPELLDVVTRLRHDGITAGLASGIDHAADALEPEEPVLLLAEACLPETDLLRAMMHSHAPAVCTLADASDHGQFERIDAQERWAGVALIDGRRVTEAAAMIGGWDPTSTLMRRAVQEGAARVPTMLPPLLATDGAAVAAAERAILRGARRPATDLIGQILFQPIEDLALPTLLARGVEASRLAAGAALLALLGGVLAFAGWPRMALLALLLSGPAAATGARLGRVRQRPRSRAAFFCAVRFAGAALASLGCGRLLAGSSAQWGWWLVGLLPIAGLLALTAERRLVPGSARLWHASVDMLIWTMLPFGIAGRWGWGLAAVALYGCGSFAALLVERLRETMQTP